MATNLFAYAVPLFIGSMIVEAAVTTFRRRSVYGLNDTFANLANGIGSQLVGLWLAALTAVIYGFVHERFGIFELGSGSPVTWVIGMLGVDLGYYWYHRLSHEVNILWATHIVHHQSEEYNLSVALRQSWFSGLHSWVFYLPLALLGVPLEVFVASYAINLVFQFIVHTKLVGKLGWLELVFNTPSHHRVHHGSNIEYLDKNYAGMLIIWDRMFGTFIEESIEPEYGLVKPLRSWNPVWANVHYWVELWNGARGMRRWQDQLLSWVKNPGWQPGDVSPADAISRAKGRVYRKFEGTARASAAIYVFVQFLMLTGCTVAVMIFGRTIPSDMLASIYLASLSSMMLWEGLLFEEGWAARAEGARLFGLVVVGFIFAMRGGLPTWAELAIFGYLIAATICYVRLARNVLVAEMAAAEERRAQRLRARGEGRVVSGMMAELVSSGTSSYPSR